MLGSWDVKVSVGALPQKVATAVGKLQEKLIGAEYTPIAYLGSQVVNGTNHAVLAEQLITTGKDTKNVVVIIFNEKPNEMDLTLVSIERVIESGGELGGITVDVKAEITGDAKETYDKVFEGFVGSDIKPFAVLGSQVVKGVNFIYAATAKAVAPEAKERAVIIIANAMTGEISFTDILNTKTDSLALGYAFTWLKKQNSSLGAPLGEWP